MALIFRPSARTFAAVGFLDDIRRLQQTAGSRPGTARVVAVRRDGEPILGVVELEIELEVSVRGARPYRAQHRELVESTMADGLALGTTLPVLVGPDYAITLASV